MLHGKKMLQCIKPLRMRSKEQQTLGVHGARQTETRPDSREKS